MKFKLIFFFLFLIFSIHVSAADQGEIFFNNKQYEKAKTFYESALKQKPNDALYNFRYARCCYELKEYDEAVAHFEKSASKYPLRDYYLAESYFYTYRFDQSAQTYQTFIAALKPDDPKLSFYQGRMQKAEFAFRLMAKVDNIAIVDSVVVEKIDFLRFYKLGSELGTLTQEPVKMGRKTLDRIKYTTQRGDRIYFSDSIHGKMNIFTKYKLLDTWSEPASLPKTINTDANENYPFLLLDGVTLYFASDCENSLGGYDIFVTRYTPSTNSYLVPENIGFPFNSPANDYMMAIDEQHKLGWFATDRNQANGKVMIYTFIPNSIRNNVRSENTDSLRQVAMLKKYRFVPYKRTTNLIPVSGEGQERNEGNQIEFVVNDSVVYTHFNQFKSTEAIRLIVELQRLKEGLRDVRNQLSDLRSRYEEQENEADRKAVAQAILDLENKNIEMQRDISAKTIQVRNEENKYLAGKKSNAAK